MTEKTEKAIIAANRNFSLMSFLGLLLNLRSSKTESSLKTIECFGDVREKNLSVLMSAGKVLRSPDEGAQRKTNFEKLHIF